MISFDNLTTKLCRKYKAKLIFDDNKLCELYIEFSWGLCFNNQFDIFENQTNLVKNRGVD